MLNGQGGYVFFGIRNDREILGQDIGKNTMEELTQELRKIEPPAFPDIIKIALPNKKTVLAVNVPGGGNIYTYEGRAYVRYGPTTSIMPKAEYQHRLMEYLHVTRRWENEPVPNWIGLGHLDEEEITLTLENAIRAGRMERPKDTGTESILRGLGLIINDSLVNAAVVLYGKDVQLEAHYPQCSIRLARFRGDTKAADFSDNRQYWGNAFSLLRKAESFLLDHVPIAGKITDSSIVRKDTPAYPSRATREALANSICHRDYTVPGGAVSLAMYNSSLEITNPGYLHFGLTLDKLTRPHESKPWNPLVAGAFYRAGIIERWGSGIINMLGWCKENGNKSPEWKVESDSVKVVFWPVNLLDKQLCPGQEKSRSESGSESRSELEAQSKAESLPDKIMSAIGECELSSAEIAAKLGKKTVSGAIKKALRKLLDDNTIQMTIPKKPNSRLQRYRLVRKKAESMAQSKAESRRV